MNATESQALVARVVSQALERSVTVIRLVNCAGGCSSHAVRIESAAGGLFGTWHDACRRDRCEGICAAAAAWVAERYR